MPQSNPKPSVGFGGEEGSKDKWIGSLTDKQTDEDETTLIFRPDFYLSWIRLSPRFDSKERDIDLSIMHRFGQLIVNSRMGNREGPIPIFNWIGSILHNNFFFLSDEDLAFPMLIFSIPIIYTLKHMAWYFVCLCDLCQRKKNRSIVGPKDSPRLTSFHSHSQSENWIELGWWYIWKIIRAWKWQ